MRRTWIKIFCDPWLRGSIRQETPELRGVFADLIAMAGDSAFGDDGIIQLAHNVGFNDDSIAGILNIPRPTWKTSRARLSNHPAGADENRIEITDVKIGFIIKIINFSKYQSEYSRQKKYRGGRLQGKLQGKLQNTLQTEGEGDIEEEEDIEREEERELRKEEKIILHLLLQVKSYPYDFKKDLDHVRKLIVEFPQLDLLNEIKKKCSWWLDHPILKKHNPRLQLRNWMENAERFSKEKEDFKPSDIGISNRKPAGNEVKFQQARDRKVEEIEKTYLSEIETAVGLEEIDAIKNKMKEEVAAWSEKYWEKKEKQKEEKNE